MVQVRFGEERPGNSSDYARSLTPLPMRCGFVYLTVVRDWASRRVLAWRLSTGLAADAAVEALEEACKGVQNPWPQAVAAVALSL
jgi:transposase InsO family protein